MSNPTPSSTLQWPWHPTFGFARKGPASHFAEPTRPGTELGGGRHSATNFGMPGRDCGVSGASLGCLLIARHSGGRGTTSPMKSVGPVATAGWPSSKTLRRGAVPNSAFEKFAGTSAAKHAPPLPAWNSGRAGSQNLRPWHNGHGFFRALLPSAHSLSRHGQKQPPRILPSARCILPMPG